MDFFIAEMWTTDIHFQGSETNVIGCSSNHLFSWATVDGSEINPAFTSWSW